jgi:hypothetical protein
MEEIPRTTSEKEYARMRSSKTINNEIIALRVVNRREWQGGSEAPHAFYVTFPNDSLSSGNKD